MSHEPGRAHLVGSDGETFAVSLAAETLTQVTTAKINSAGAFPIYRLSDDHAWIVMTDADTGQVSLQRTMSVTENPDNTDPMKIAVFRQTTIPKIHYLARDQFIFEAIEDSATGPDAEATESHRYLVSLMVNQDNLGEGSTEETRSKAITRFTAELGRDDFPAGQTGAAALLGAGPITNSKDFWLITKTSLKILQYDEAQDNHFWLTQDHGLKLEQSIPVQGVTMDLGRDENGQLKVNTPPVILMGSTVLGYFGDPPAAAAD